MTITGRNCVRRAALVTVSAIALSPVSAWAQGTEASSGSVALQEVVVTATKRAENVQDVPISITAFTAEAMQAKGVTEVVSLGNLAPNVTLDAGTPFSGSSSVLSAFIRGIGQNDFAFNLDPGVGVYLDGVYLARSVGANQDLLDVERVEVLKGPQGTLFGRNTIGGAISIVTRRPGDTFAFKGDVTTGRFNRLDIKAAADLPISETLLSSVSFSSKKRDGYQKLVPFPGAAGLVQESDGFPTFGRGHPTDFGDYDEWGARAKLLWKAADNVEVTLTGDYSHQANNGVASTPLKTHTDIATGGVFGFFYNTCINTPAAVLQSIGFGLLCGPRNAIGTPLAGRNVDGAPGNDLPTYGDQFISPDIDKTYATGNSFSRMKNYGSALTLDWDLGGPALKSITAYRRLDWHSAQDEDGSPAAFLETSFEMKQKQFSEELQLTGDALEQRLKYVFGAYYFTESGNLHDLVTFPGGLLQIDGNNLLKTRAYAAYTNLNYALTDKLSVTLGARYTREKKQFEGFQADPNAFFYKINGLVPSEANRIILCDATGGVLCYPDPSNILRVYPVGRDSLSFNNFSPKVGLEFRPSGDLMLYGSYSRGYKTGGWTTRLTQPPLRGQEPPTFGPEKATTWEVGVKSELADRRVILNLAGFHTDYQGIQLNFQVGTSPTIANAGEAEIYGFEAELQARPTRALTLQAGVGYTHARYSKVQFGVTGVTEDARLPKTPAWKFSFSPQYEIDLGERGSILLSADYVHTSSLYNDTENTPLLKRPATDVLNASATYREPGEKWSVSVGGTNLLDERYLTTGHNQVTGGVTYGTYSRPVEWYAALRINF